jgi:predicted house-cleaning NTP pyrophosphatase (Maf/HAM1 superfamily)
MAKRAEIMKRRKVTDEYMASWFDSEPVSRPAPKPSARVLARLKAARG